MARLGLTGFIFLLLWCGSISADAQPSVIRSADAGFVFHNLDNRNGLLSDNVFSVTQDKKGFIWIGTGKGLQRYDGFGFQNFIDSGREMSNDGLIVSTLYADERRDRILYNQYYRQMQERSGFHHRPGLILPEKEFDPSKAISYTGHDGARWQRQRYFLAKTSGNGRVSEGIDLVKEPSADKPYFAFFFTDNKTKETWISEPRHHLLFFDDSAHTGSDPAAEPGKNNLFSLISKNQAAVRKILMDHEGNLWVVGWSDILYRIAAGSASMESYDLSETGKREGISAAGLTVWGTSVLEDDHGTIWVGTAHAGLLRFQADSNRFFAIRHRAGDALSVQYNHEINNLYQDKEENIWVASDKGVGFFNPYRQDFLKPDQATLHPENVPGSELNAALADSSGNILAGYWGGGMEIYDKNLQLKKTLRFSSPETNMLWGLIKDRDGITWVACQHGYIQQLDKQYNLIKTLHPPEMENSTIRCLARDGAGNLYFGLHTGRIVCWNAGEQKFLPFATDPPLAGMTLSSVLNIFFDAGDHCWVGTMNGLALFDKQKRSYTGFYKPLIDMPTPCHGIDQVNDSVLAVGFENAGLYFFNLRTRTFQKPAGTDATSTSVYAVKKDSAGNIWFTKHFDICRYDLARQTVSLNSPEDGYLNSGFEGNYFVTTPSGKWFTWTKTEMIGFATGPLTDTEKINSPVRITGLSVFDKPVFIDSVLKIGNPVSLSYKNNFLGISFSNLLFTNAGRTRYFYRLSGVDKDWVDNGAGHLASYTSLAPGHYRFEVTTGSAANLKDMAVFDLVLTPPFWQTNWFRALVVLIFAGVVFLIVTGYIRNIRRESEMKQQIVQTEMMALRAQMNPHFIFNCINSIDALIQSDDKYLATVYLNKFAKLIRNILDSSKEATVTLKRDLETLELYVELERFRNRDNFSVEIRTDDQLLQQDLRVPPLIIQPYVENAILHGLRHRVGGQGKLTIDISRENDRLRYVIEDNGVGRGAGRTNNKKYRSYGMEMSLDRLKLFNQQSDIPVVITDLVQDGQAAGTRVEVSLQIK